MSETPPLYRGTAQSYFRSPWAPRMHFDEAGGGGQQQQQQAPWHQGIDNETIGHIQNKGWSLDDPKALVTEMAKAWKGAERHIGAPADRIIRLPEKADDAAGWNAVRQKLGAPKEASEYDFTNVPNLEQGMADRLRTRLHAAGTPKDAAVDIARGVAEYLSSAAAEKATAAATKLTSEQAALKTEWGNNFDFNRLTAMQGVKRAIGGDDAAAEAVISAMQESIGYKGTMEFWRKIGAGTSESTFHEGGTTGNPTTMQGAIARKEELMNDPEWSKRYMAGGAKEVAEMNGLIALITGAAA